MPGYRQTHPHRVSAAAVGQDDRVVMHGVLKFATYKK